MLQRERRKNERPSHGIAKACHHSMSSLKDSVRWRVSWRENVVMVRSSILCRKVLPAGMTLAAKLRMLIRERSSCFRQWVHVDHVLSSWWISQNRCGARRASRATESRRIPRYSNWGDGPSNLSSARGTPRPLQGKVREWRLRWQWGEEGASHHEKIIKVVVDGVDTMLCGDPFDSISETAEDEGG